MVVNMFHYPEMLDFKVMTTIRSGKRNGDYESQGP